VCCLLFFLGKKNRVGDDASPTFLESGSHLVGKLSS
jgi:hypothetical protein